MIQKKFEQAINNNVDVEKLGRGMIVSGIEEAAIACEAIHKEECKIAMKWIMDNYTEIYSSELDKHAYVPVDVGVLLHGSDYHYTELINKYGKTLDQLFDLFNEDKTIKP